MKRKFTVKASTSAKRRICESINNNGIYVDSGDYIRFTIDGKSAIGKVEADFFSKDYPGNMVYKNAFESGMVLWDISYIYDEVNGRSPQWRFMEHVPANEIEDVQKIDTIEYRDRIEELFGFDKSEDGEWIEVLPDNLRFL